MKILHVTPYYLPAVRYGGPIYSISGLCESLVKLGHEVTVFTTNVDGPDTIKQATCNPQVINAVEVLYFNSPFLRKMFWAPALWKHLEGAASDYGIIHIHTSFVWPSFIAAYVAKKHGIPYIFSPRGMLDQSLFSRKSWLFKWVWFLVFGKSILRHAAKVHVTADRERSAIERLFNENCHYINIPNGVNGSEDSTSRDFLDVEIKNTVMFLGRIHPIKGLDRLIRAWSHVRTAANLVIAGNDDDNYSVELTKLAKKYGVQNRISFRGPVYGIEKWSLLAGAQCFVLPSYSENFGNVVLEAMLSGCPVVVTTEVGAAEVVEAAGAGIVTDGDPQLLANAINRILDDPILSEGMGEAGRDIAINKYSWDFIALDMARVYTSCLSREGDS